MRNLINPLKRNSLTVPPDDESRYTAVQELTRPDEIESLLRPPTITDLFTPFIERVARWHQARLQAGILSYLPDPATRDIWQSPAQTLKRGGGDCEDLALLLLSVLEHQQIEAVLSIGTFYGRGHAWIEGRDAISGFLIEATTGALVRRQRPLGYHAERYFGRGVFNRIAA